MQQSELRAWLEEHHDDAFGWSLSCCDWERALAEDVLQTSYLKVLDGRAVFAGRSSFKTWLFAVIRRTAAEKRRRRMLRRFVPLDRAGDALRSPSGDPEEQATASERSSRLVAGQRTCRRCPSEANAVFRPSRSPSGEEGRPRANPRLHRTGPSPTHPVLPKRPASFRPRREW